MKEILTKRFWQDVKKTFEDARDGPAEDQPAPPPVEQVPGSQPKQLAEQIPSPGSER